MIAEESTAFTGVTHALEYGGLGFDYKWNMGWMNDTLRYFIVDPLFRNYHLNDVTFVMMFAFSERFTLVLSHDEVVHGKKSLLSKMPGDLWQKFANLRLLYSYMICQPGKKLLFMGGEIGQWNEWNCKSIIEWFLLEYPTHRGIQSLVRDLNHFYLHSNALWENDTDYNGFEWIDYNDRQNCVISYLRKGHQSTLLCVHNFTPHYHENYSVRIKGVWNIREVFNTDALRYGGSGKENSNPQIVRDREENPISVNIHLSPLATMIFAIDFNAYTHHPV